MFGLVETENLDCSKVEGESSGLQECDTPKFLLWFSAKKNFVVFEKRPFKIFQKTFLLKNFLSFGKVFILASNFGV